MSMETITPESPEAQSANLIAKNIEALRKLFPELITEGPEGVSVNVDVLKQLVGDRTVTDCDEKYGLNWFGKRRARQLALTPSTGTLRPCPEESENWDTTQNLFIEGDNLEVLKLLQKSYAGKVKLIYIDPPYNTGKDFVYKDDYRDNIKNYKKLTGQVDEEGSPLTTNTEASGRFHTDWLNMMYPRLKLARNLLQEDGLVFISIDDVEAARLRLLLDDIFGDDNFIAVLIWKKSYGGGAKAKHVVGLHEYIIVYARDKEKVGFIELPHDPAVIKYYKYKDEKFEQRGPYRTQPLATTSMDDRPNLRFPILWEGVEIWPEKQWQWSRDRVEKALAENELVITKRSGKWVVDYKQYLKDKDGKERGAKPFSLLEGPYTQIGTKEIRDLEMGNSGFTFPKPLNLIMTFLNYGKPDDTILDFFAGSGTTGHAVMAQNAKDGGNRRYILAQLPEPLDPEKKEQKTAAEFCDKLGKPRTIAELTKERLRRAARKIKEEHPDWNGDTGFRVFKLDSSNIKAWNPHPEEDVETQLEAFVDHIEEGRTEADLLYELLLKLGLDLCVPIEQREIAGKTVYAIGGGVLMACLAGTITTDEVEALGQGIVEWHKALAPAGDTTCVFRDSAFENDVAKTTLAAILEQAGIPNVRSL